MPFSQAELERAGKIRAEVACHLNRKGPVIVGEKHNEPHPRGMIANLINQGNVQCLCLELDDVVISEFIPDLPTNTSLGMWLRQRATGKKPIHGNPTWQLICQNLMPLTLGRNPITLARLIEFAVEKGVAIYFIDTFQVSYDQNPASPAIREAREAQMVIEINRKQRNKRGTVILVGSAHNKGLQQRMPTAMSIKPPRPARKTQEKKSLMAS